MKKVRVIVFTFFIMLPAVIFAGSIGMDFGGNLNNISSASDNFIQGSSSQTAVSQADKLSLWFTSYLGQNYTFTSSGSYSFFYSYDNGAGEIIPYLFDIDLFNLYGKFPAVPEKGQAGPGGQKPSLFSFRLGRFNTADFSQYVLNHKIDGFKLVFGYPNAVLSMSLGYTGFLAKPNSSILLSKADYTDSNNSKVIFASPRAIGIANLTLLNIFRQELSFSLIFQQDLRKALIGSELGASMYPASVIEEGEESLDTSAGGLIDTQYIGLGAKGMVIPSLYYRAFSYLGTGRTLSYIDNAYTYEPILSFLGGARVRYFISSFLNSYAELNFLYASGDSTDSSFAEGNIDKQENAFLPISSYSTGLVFSPKLENIFLVKTEYSALPLKDIQTVVGMYSFFRSTKGPISEAGINTNSTSLYLGTEIDGTVNYKPFSDLGLAFSTGVFIPNSSAPDISTPSAFSSTERGIEVKGKLEFSLAF